MRGETMGQDAYLAILDRAIESEIEAARFYANVAEKTADNYLKEQIR
jgi:rubrerythrin